MTISGGRRESFSTESLVRLDPQLPGSVRVAAESTRKIGAHLLPFHPVSASVSVSSASGRVRRSRSSQGERGLSPLLSRRADPDKESPTCGGASYTLQLLCHPLSCSPAARCPDSSPSTLLTTAITMASAALPKRIIKVSLSSLPLFLSSVRQICSRARGKERGTSPLPLPTDRPIANQRGRARDRDCERTPPGPSQLVPPRPAPTPSAGHLQTADHHHHPRREERDPTALTLNPPFPPIFTTPGNAATRRRFSTRYLGRPARRQPAIL